MMDDNKSEIERLGRMMSLSARSEPGLVGGAIATWEAAHPGQTAKDYLKCNDKQLWRVAIAPLPTGPRLAERAIELATDVGVNPMALVNVLRFAENARAFADASEDGEMLMAALDDSREDKT